MYRIILAFMLVVGCATTKSQDQNPPNPVLERIILNEGSIPYPYLVKPGDCLSRIALAEYGDTSRWHWIYAWNRAKIGDNPNIIHPYREFQLRGYKEYDVRYVFHDVKSGETLWAIAELYFGDGRAWHRIYRDNRGIIESFGRIYPGQRLRIRRE